MPLVERLRTRECCSRLSPATPPPAPHGRYLLHEAIAWFAWSPVRNRWFALPRRMSQDAYDETEDETRGANTIITATPDFSSFTATTVGVSWRGVCA